VTTILILAVSAGLLLGGGTLAAARMFGASHPVRDAAVMGVFFAAVTVVLAVIIRSAVIS
jgi:hypothetical protein